MRLSATKYWRLSRIRRGTLFLRGTLWSANICTVISSLDGEPNLESSNSHRKLSSWMRFRLNMLRKILIGSMTRFTNCRMSEYPLNSQWQLTKSSNLTSSFRSFTHHQPNKRPLHHWLQLLNAKTIHFSLELVLKINKV